MAPVRRASAPAKLYSLPEPEVACITTGKGRIPYEFGSKISVIKEGFVLDWQALRGNAYDVPTLHGGWNG